MTNITIIAAVDKNMGIGFQNKLLFWLPNDLKHFKTLTTGHTIVMGRKTFESLPNGPLPNRRNIVISTNQMLKISGADVFSSLEEAIESCKKEEEEIYIIGGESIYKQSLPIANKLCLTEIDSEAKNIDAFFPTIDKSNWKEVSREVHPKDDKHPYSYSFVNYIKR